eukprot:TRINITY_DN7260_c0_g1_i5.p1 TRINITY_DN7260_c0_g1~~TRINITY_DN7260_c0_g1_i5.p1  ORF type:complete len:477 (+),score=81.95 TRINITY_DN7260_c0_g1_i5:90-1520(+)
MAIPKRLARAGVFLSLFSVFCLILIQRPRPQHAQSARDSTLPVPIYLQEEHQNAQSRCDLAIPARYSKVLHGQDGCSREVIRTSNDDFITDAIHAGLIDSVTWVVPDWGQANEYDLFDSQWRNGYVDPSNASLSVGITAMPSSLDAVIAEHENGDEIDESDDDSPPFNVDQLKFGKPCDRLVTGAYIGDMNMECSSYQFDSLPCQYCSVQRQVPLEVMVGSVAIERGFNVWNDATSPDIILDIDEDYFATSDAIVPLKTVGWTNRTLAQVDHVLGQLCSPSEALEHALAQDIVNAIKGHERLKKGNFDTLYVCDSPRQAGKTFHSILNELHTVLSAIRQQQPADYTAMITVLLRVGFAVTPRSERGLALEFPAPMAVCTGVDQQRNLSSPLYLTNDMVMHYTPDPDELDRLLEEFRSYLIASGIVRHVRVVTLVRSIRDGYLPQHLWSKIESSILTTLKELLPQCQVIMDGRVSWS